MTYIVQDMLDYAQIKSNNFRKASQQFDIRQSVEKVMTMQRQNAQDRNLEFTVEFVNINEL